MKVKLFGIRVVLEENDSNTTTVYLVADDVKMRIGSSNVIDDIYLLEQEARGYMFDIMEVAELEQSYLKKIFPDKFYNSKEDSI